MEWLHKSVLLNEVIDFIGLKTGGTYADLTFGEGGHTEALLRGGAKEVWAVDRDLSAVEAYRKLGALKEDPRLKLNHLRFSEFAGWANPTLFDGILLDLGVSTRQLISQERGFTFQKTAPLDMRMDQSKGPTVKDLLEGLTEDELADIFYYNADLKNSRYLAKKILTEFQKGRIQTTQDLADCFGKRTGKAHPATVPFMALRMAVNQELEEISETLPQLIHRLKPGGRLVVITFHSTEDRKVKTIFKKMAGRCICHELICQCSKKSEVKILTKKPVEPSSDELAQNPRSRSAKLRCVEKI
ncbi:16S rRNA (cytosine(1402)-N(4))-methyltransferase RsmH [bacterium]|nr:16S rRNA (cytosine(1402)-N(4))-methyltransferase RsmH [bacterium]